MSLSDKNPKRRRPRKSTAPMTWSILFKYYLSLLIFVVGLFAAMLIAEYICSKIVWYPENELYRFLIFIRDRIFYIFGFLVIAGLAVITYRLVSKLIGYLNRIVDAAKEMLSQDSKPVVLPAEIKIIQDELNRLREEALKNAAAAKEAEQRKNDLIVYLAHDLKTPLTSVIGYLNLLKEQPELSSELRTKYTGIALEKAERLEDLINEFFDITRFNLSSITLETSRISLSRMMEQLCDEFNPVLAEKGLIWQTDIEKNVDILCDPDKLERVFDNLIRNAVNYGYENSVITLTLRKVAADTAEKQDMAEITVRNHGRTIPPEKLNRIFEQFFRLDSSRTSSTGGSGLGLAIAKEITELHGGSIRAESFDERIIFTVTLPLS